MGEVFAGRYELVDPVGRGGVGAVWRAWDHRRRRYVAAKVLQQRNAHTLLRFVREQALRIDHPHVLAPASWAADDDQVLFTMDLITGGSLAHVIGDYGPLPARFACTLLDQLLAGLAAVHAEGVVHRDIKPANILLEATGTGRPHLRVSDFGISMRKGEPRLTETDYVVGTPGYFAPEQMMGAEPDFTADLFAAGLVALYLLQGAKPDAKALIEHFAAHGTPGAPRGVPEPLWQVLATLLQPDPQARFRTATGARKALASAVEMLPEAGPDDETVEIFDQLAPLPTGFGPEGPLTRAPQPPPQQPPPPPRTPDPTTPPPHTPGQPMAQPWAPAPATAQPRTPGSATPQPWARPVTQNPVAQAPASPAPETHAPVAQASVGQAPVAQAPMGQAPVAQAPMGQPSMPQAPAAHPQVTPAQVTPPPATPAPVPQLGGPPTPNTPNAAPVRPTAPPAHPPTPHPPIQRQPIQHPPMSESGSFPLPPPALPPQAPPQTPPPHPVQPPTPPTPFPPHPPASASGSVPGTGPGPGQGPGQGRGPGPVPGRVPALAAEPVHAAVSPYAAQPEHVPVGGALTPGPLPEARRPARHQARHAAGAAARATRPGPPAKVALPMLLAALACFALGFWALSQI
ncbi:protein kinase [Streptomyces sp. NPDC017940]|uniref:serine/threonine-protein kinase n=1 Tax=Streptomyces sp. NPDC017940 TaxID=3365017 RepID=UPI0037B4ADDB